MTALARIEQLIPSAINPRRSFNEARDTELLESIRTHGVLTPLIVRPLETAVQVLERSETSSGIVCVPAYEIVAGHRRYAAASELGLPEVPVVVRDLDDDQARAVAIVENLQREDLAPLDEARSYRELLDFTNSRETPASLARKVGKPERHIWARLALLTLSDDAQAFLAAGRITVAHAEAIARLTPEDQARVCDPIRGGLWRPEQTLGMFDPYEDATDREHEGMLDDETLEAWDRRDELLASAPVSLRELEAWIVKNIRFDVGQAAQVAPLDFGELPARITAAEAQPGRGRRVVSITHLHQCPSDARGEDRTLTRSAWRRADTPCPKTALGVVVVGPHYGEDFTVCIDKDCEIHWAEEIKARKREAKAREKQAQRTPGGTAYPKDDWEREHELRLARQKVWEAARPEVEKAVLPLLKHIKTTVQQLRDLVAGDLSPDEMKRVETHLGQVSFDSFGAWLAAAQFYDNLYNEIQARAWLKERGLKVDLAKIVKDAEASLKPKSEPAPVAKAAKRAKKERAA